MFPTKEKRKKILSPLSPRPQNLKEKKKAL
jgi:hypothetical protein